MVARVERDRMRALRYPANGDSFAPSLQTLGRMTGGNLSKI